MTSSARLHRMLVGFAALVLSAVTGVGAAGSAGAAPYCGITWGSVARSGGTLVASRVIGVRAGRHACYDRMVIDVRGRAPGYAVRYVSAVRAEGSGRVVPTAGGARLQVTVDAAAYRRPALPSVTGWRTFREITWAGSFEGYTTFGLGVRARLPFRVFTLYDARTDTSRVVVDVAHRW